MVPVRLLSEPEFKATMSSPMQNATDDSGEPFDIWGYVRAVPPGDYEGHALPGEFVERVYRSADGRFDHVLVMTRTKNVYLAVVVDLAGNRVHGHHLLDLNQKSGATENGGDRS